MARLALVCATAALLQTAAVSARPAPRFNDPVSLSTPVSETSWVVTGLLQGRPYRLASEPWQGILERFLEPYRNHTPEWRAFLRGAYSPSRHPWLPELRWDPAESRSESAGPLVTETPGATAFSIQALTAPLLDRLPTRAAFADALDWGPRPEPLAVAPRRPCPAWKMPRPVVVVRASGEREVLRLVDCEGAIPSDAIERVSVLARPPSTPRPELPLPMDARGEGGEWLPDVRLLHPRLMWVLSRIAEAFPGRSLVVYSGYRRDGHSSFHTSGRALDLAVTGVPSAAVFAVCRTLRDVGCGFYPNNRFVHMDVRAYGTGRVAWVDTSEPGAPSTYVDGWPGVLSPGIAWLGAPSR